VKNQRALARFPRRIYRQSSSIGSAGLRGLTRDFSYGERRDREIVKHSGLAPASR